MNTVEEIKANAFDVERDGIVWVRYRCPCCKTEWAWDKACTEYNYCPKCDKEIVLRYGTDDNE